MLFLVFLSFIVILIFFSFTCLLLLISGTEFHFLRGEGKKPLLFNLNLKSILIKAIKGDKVEQSQPEAMVELN